MLRDKSEAKTTQNDVPVLNLGYKQHCMKIDRRIVLYLRLGAA
jgi:hypothetical protein